ncbi:MAG: hypothetical protein BIFFINMI_03546 [Phycisphaerae bacterium]|nr:hypothetical protein [Phycisphaerae bacterium]
MWTRIIFKELWRRKWGFLFSVVAVSAAAAVLVLVVTVSASMQQAFRGATLATKQNLMVVSADADPQKFYRGDLGSATMPESVMDQLTDRSRVVQITMEPKYRADVEHMEVMKIDDPRYVNREPVPRNVYYYPVPDLGSHFQAEFQTVATITLGGRTFDGALLTGQREEEGRRTPSPGGENREAGGEKREGGEKGEGGGEKKQLVTPAPPGHAALGKAIAQALGAKVGDTIEAASRQPAATRTFKIASIKPAAGTMDDVRVYAALDDVQKMLNAPGRINRVMILSCKCDQLLTSQIADVFQASLNMNPGGQADPVRARVLMFKDIADARDRVRNVSDKIVGVMTPTVAAICVLLIGGYFYFNVRERQQEIGVMLAVGHTPAPIILILLAKLLMVALLGALIGGVGGIYVARAMRAPLNLRALVEPWDQWWQLLVGALGVAALASVWPLLVAGRTRAADILRNS